MSNSSTRLTDLPNIGPTVARRLAAVGIRSRADLERLGPAEAWRRMQARDPGATLPTRPASQGTLHSIWLREIAGVCYYLYSLQGAILGCHWHELPPGEKERLVREAKG